MAHDSGGDVIAALADWIVAVQAADLTPTARRVGATLIRWARIDLSGHVWPSAPTVGKVLGLDPDRVREAFRDLRRAGFLVADVRPGESTRYTLALPMGAVPSPELGEAGSGTPSPKLGEPPPNRPSPNSGESPRDRPSPKLGDPPLNSGSHPPLNLGGDPPLILGGKEENQDRIESQNNPADAGAPAHTFTCKTTGSVVSGLSTGEIPASRPAEQIPESAITVLGAQDAERAVMLWGSEATAALTDRLAAVPVRSRLQALSTLRDAVRGKWPTPPTLGDVPPMRHPPPAADHAPDRCVVDAEPPPMPESPEERIATLMAISTGREPTPMPRADLPAAQAPVSAPSPSRGSGKADNGARRASLSPAEIVERFAAVPYPERAARVAAIRAEMLALDPRSTIGDGALERMAATRWWRETEAARTVAAGAAAAGALVSVGGGA